MDEQLQMQHKEQKQGFLFLYALSQELKDRAKTEGFDVSEFIPILSKFYHVRELKSNTIVDAFAVTNQFKYIIILAHHNNDDSLVLSDESHLQMSHLISLLPDDLQGSVLDFAICKSDSVADIIKAKTHCEHVLSTKGYTDLKPRFLTYLFLPGYMKAHPETDDYLVAYSSCLSELKHKVGKKNLRHSTTKLGTMATGERPYEVKRNSMFYVKVIFHDESSEETIEKNIINAYTIPYKIKHSILDELKDGDAIQLDLCLDTYYPEMKQHLEGEGSFGPFPYKKDADSTIEFKCYVKAGFLENNIDGTLTISIKDSIVNIWRFMIEVIPHINEPVNDSFINEGEKDYSKNRPKPNLSQIPRFSLKPKEQKSRTNTKDFAQCVTKPERAEAVINRLKDLIKDLTKPRDIMRCFRAAKDAGAIHKPEWKAFCSEFGSDKIKSKTSFNDWLNESYNEYDRNSNKASLDVLIEEFKKLIT